MPPQNRKAVKNGEDGNETSQSSSDLNRESRGLNNPNQTDPNGKNPYSRQEFPNGQKSTIDYTKSQVNIAQILTDFKNTAIAIGSPPNIIQEVNQYLSLAETQSLKNEPNKKIIQSNLKNASNVLDDFISKTLNKNSKVVENWIEALFLQQVNYKSDPESINEDFLVKLPDKQGDMQPISKDLSDKNQPPKAESNIQTAATAPQSVPPQTSPIESAAQKGIYIPQDSNVRKAFIQGKKYSAINEQDKALSAFQASLNFAKSVGDNNAEGMICYEMGQIFDKNDDLENALKFYNQAHNATNDNNLKAKSYYSMAKIYDDVVYFEPAMEHYFAAISFAGEAENLNAQTKALTQIGDMYAERYDVYKTHEFYGTAKNIALATNDTKTMGSVWSKSGDAMTVLNENVNALQDYKASAQFYENAESPIKMAKNYEKASQVMLKLGNKNKALSLLEKAQQLALSANDSEYAQKLSKHLI